MVLLHECLIGLFLVGVTSSNTEDNSISLCDKGQFECAGGGCIDYTSVCDGIPDCSDYSDENELQCLNFRCPVGISFKCAYGGCIEAGKECDGKTDCLIDNSDEDRDLCGYSQPICSSIQFTCRSGECIDKSLYCNQQIDCLDGSDETDTKCISRFFGNNLCDLTGKLSNNVRYNLLNCSNENSEQVCVEFYCNEGYVLDDFKERYLSKCKDGQWVPKIPECIACGQYPSRPLIYGGTIAKEPEPWHVGFYRYTTAKDDFVYFCAGTLVHSRAVVSAAHCFKKESDDVLAPPIDRFKLEHLRVTVNKLCRTFNLTSIYTSKECNETFRPEHLQVFEVETIKFNSYMVRSFVHDIAVVILQRKIDINGVAVPACLGNLVIPTPGLRGKTVGWGKNEDDVYSETLREGFFTVLSGPAACRHELGKRDQADVYHDKMCLGEGPELGLGDSGGGFIVSAMVNCHTQSNFPKCERHFLAGIVSIKLPSGVDIMTNVSYHMGWLLNALEVP